MYDPFIISRSTYPNVMLKRFPTPGEVEYLRQFIVRYKGEHPQAKNPEIRTAAQKEFDNKFNKKLNTNPFNKSKNYSRPTGRPG